MADLPLPSLPSSPYLLLISSLVRVVLSDQAAIRLQRNTTHPITHSLTRQPEPHEHVQNMSALPRNKQQRRNSNSELATSYIAHKTNLPSLSRFLSRACRPPVRRKAPYRPLPLRIWGNREHNPINAPLHVHAVPAVTLPTPKKHSAESSAVNRMYSDTASTLSACS